MAYTAPYEYQKTIRNLISKFNNTLITIDRKELRYKKLIKFIRNNLKIANLDQKIEDCLNNVKEIVNIIQNSKDAGIKDYCDQIKEKIASIEEKKKKFFSHFLKSREKADIKRYFKKNHNKIVELCKQILDYKNAEKVHYSALTIQYLRKIINSKQINLKILNYSLISEKLEDGTLVVHLDSERNWVNNNKKIEELLSKNLKTDNH